MAKKYPKLSITLKRLLFERDMKPVDLAREVDLPQPTIHRLVTGKSTRPYKSSLKPIADFFSLSVDQLLGEENVPNNYWQDETPALPSTHSIKTIPIIDWSKLNDLKSAKAEGREVIATIGNISDDCFALIMHDYSMEPLFPKQTILIFDPCKSAVDRSYVLVKLKGCEMPTFRQILVDIDQQYLKPLNPDLNTYQMRLLSPEDKIIATLFESRVSHQTSNKALIEL